MNFHHYFRAILVVWVSTLIGIGCYPKAVGPVGLDGRKLKWADMSFEQRKEHMGKEIMPKAASLFASWRPDRYADATCSLCHRQGQQNGSYDMPTAALPRLSGDLLLGTEFSKHPETTRLKLNRLVPMMSEALGLKPFSIVTRTGFGCYSCHLGPTGAMFGN